VEIRILGEVAVHGPDGPVQLQRVGERLLLAALAIEVRRPVPAERLLNMIDENGDISVGTLVDYVSAVRRALTAAGGSRTMLPPARRSGAYILDIDPDQVDYQRYRKLAAAAGDHAAAGKHAAAIAAYQQALDLWTGPPLANVRNGADGLRQGLHDEYHATIYKLLTQQLHAGDHDQAHTIVTRLLHEQVPTDQLIVLALHVLARSGRHADIPALLTRATQRMQAMVGAQPGEQVRQLARRLLADPGQSQTLLRAGPSLDRAAAADENHVPDDAAMAGTELSRPVPRQLPAPAQVFTGRITELADLVNVHDASTVVITAIDGMAGVGKTALAVQAAHQMAGRYPDGQLFIDLHGYTQGVTPIEPGDALDRLLRSLGVAVDRLPSELEERAGLFRSRLADQRMLIVLDNAATEDQVMPLLPGAPGCLVLVTSRRRLAGLDHTHTLSLDTLPPADAVTLLRHTTDESRLAGQPPDLVAELVELCDLLPLAIRIAAARLRSHPSWQVSHLVERLRDQRHRLGELAAGQRSVTAALDLSYRDLTPDQQRAYRLLGLHPGTDIDVYATAALLDSTVPDTGRLLDQLLEAHLLQEPTPGRYRFHDLTRAHATADHAATPATALDRLLDYYRYTAATAVDVAYPYEWAHRQQVPPAHVPRPRLPDAAAALAWLDTELPNLLAAALQAAGHGRTGQVLHVSTILHRHLVVRGRYQDAEALHRHALDHASAANHQASQLTALTGLGEIHWRQGRYGQAADHFQRALQIARRTGNRSGELAALTGLGDVHRRQGRYGQAADHFQQALQIARAIGHRPGELTPLYGLGNIHRLQDRYAPAADHFQQALQIARAIGHRPGELNALIGLGDTHQRQGRYRQAAEHYQQVLQIARAIGHRPAELNALNGLGQTNEVQGRYAQAVDHFEQALQIARSTGHRIGEQVALSGLGNIHRLRGRYAQAADYYQRMLDLTQESGDRNWQFEAWQGLGRLRHTTGDPVTAIAHHERALTIAGELRQPHDQARAHDGLAHAHHALNEDEQARQHWQHALDILTRLGVDHTDDEEATAAAIRSHLANLGPQEAAAPKD
jgi:tetratricopeptide (TPR) repeat protein/DNA-binding SARP family transcriptional activator